MASSIFTNGGQPINWLDKPKIGDTIILRYKILKLIDNDIYTFKLNTDFYNSTKASLITIDYSNDKYELNTWYEQNFILKSVGDAFSLNIFKGKGNKTFFDNTSFVFQFKKSVNILTPVDDTPPMDAQKDSNPPVNRQKLLYYSLAICIFLIILRI